jgi:dTDP-4-dehydrorhamnose reductase
MKILVTGCNGQLGWELGQLGARCGLDMILADLPSFDITDENDVRKEISRPGLDWVINAAAYTAVDRAESEPEKAFSVNQRGPSLLASYCERLRIPVIHISTDYVFDGTKPGLYNEADPVSPLCVYGKSKSAGEAEIEKRLTRYLIVRTSWLYCVHGNNFVKTILRLASEKPLLRVVNDQYGSPTYAKDLAEALLAIVEGGYSGREIQWGTYHFCGAGITSRYEFAKKICALAKKYRSFKVEEFVPIPSSEYTTPARRPKNCALDCRKVTKAFGVVPKPWQTSLGEMIQRLFSTGLKEEDHC